VTDSRVGIVDLEMGNLRSVSNAIDHLGYDAALVTGPGELASLTHLVLPGVGSFHTAMRRMHQRDLVKATRQFAASGRPVLGLCLGMQILADWGDEGERTEGLGLVPGEVRRLDEKRVTGGAVPHVGWNAVEWVGTHPVLRGIRSGADFYFVHSYYVASNDPATVLGTTEYGERFPSVMGRDNVLGFQFHPEKSQANGLRLIEAFCGWDGRC
jgi:glutamine amidotransferase